jgi:hypothetical protein
LFTTFARPKLEYACVVWNSITSTDSSKLKIGQTICCLMIWYLCTYVAIIMKVYKIDWIFQHFSPGGGIYTPFSLLMYLKQLSCLSTFGSLSARISTRIIRDYSAFIVNHNFKVSLSARCVCSASAFCKNTDIFNKDYTCVSLTDIL